MTVDERVVRTADGTRLRVYSVGKGPALVIVHGSGTTAADYSRLAGRLADTHRVHRYDRRGRAGIPRPRQRSLAVDVADLVAVVRATASRAVLGHDFGALVALEAARDLELTRLVLLDAAVKVDPSFPTSYVPRFADAVALRDLPLAIARRRRGRRTGRGADLPLGLQRAVGRVLLATGPGGRKAELLPADLDEDRQLALAAGRAQRWSDIGTETLLTVGAGSPEYLAVAGRLLAAAMPNARYAVVPGSGPGAPLHARRAVVGLILGFLDVSTGPRP